MKFSVKAYCPLNQLAMKYNCALTMTTKEYVYKWDEFWKLDYKYTGATSEQQCKNGATWMSFGRYTKT